MTDGAAELETQSSWPLVKCGMALPSSQAGGSRSKLSLPENLLNSIPEQVRCSLSLTGSGPLFFENENMDNSTYVLSHSIVQNKVAQVIKRARSCGYSKGICQDRYLCNHFSRLPARYTLDITVQGHEDVLLHMSLINDAWKGEASPKDNPLGGPYALRQVHVREVQLVLGPSILVLKIPKPTFGSSTDLAGLLVGSLKVHPSTGPIKTQSNAPTIPTPTEMQILPSLAECLLPPTFGPFVNPLAMESNNAGDQDYSFGYEITLATSDKSGLLKFFSNILSGNPLQFNIREAYLFSTSDGMALEVLVVEGWPSNKPDDLKEALLEVLSNELHSQLPTTEPGNDVHLKSALEGFAYEDWTIDFETLDIGEQIEEGSSGRLYKGKYRRQDVAIKIMELNDRDVNLENKSRTLHAIPAMELCQIFKQEVSIMRLVWHKNLIQFTGACSSWPKLYIVTELMVASSVRDVMDRKGSGLDIPMAMKVLRDAAKGMDFLHRRGIVHRDLKAANLLIDEHEVVKVCDFGLARPKPALLSNSERGAAEMTAEVGTYRWMAPEVLEHNPYDHKVDVYSFGIMIWEVITGEVPYAGLAPLQAAIGVVQRGLRPTMPAEFPQKLANLSESCWHQDPQQRPEFNEAVAVLEDLIKPPQVKKSLLWKKKFMSCYTIA